MVECSETLMALRKAGKKVESLVGKRVLRMGMKRESSMVARLVVLLVVCLVDWLVLTKAVVKGILWGQTMARNRAVL